MSLFTVEGKLEDLGAGGGVEASVLKGAENFVICKLVGKDHCKSTEGVAVGSIKSLSVVVVVSRVAADALAAHEHTVIYLCIVLATVNYICSVVVYLHREKSLVANDILLGLH